MNLFAAFFARFRPIAGPTSLGTNGQVLTSDGAGATSWADSAAADVTKAYVDAADATLTAAVAAKLAKASNLSDLANAGTARTNLGLGTAAVANTTAFEASGAVATHAALTTGVHGISTFGSTLIDDADAPTARTTLAAAGTGVANTFTAQQTFETGAAGASPLIVKQSGGGATKQIELSHDGTDAKIQGKAGELRIVSAANLRLYSSGGNSVLFRNSGDTATLLGIDAQGIVTAKAFVTTSPAQITANQNDYNPGQSNFYRLNSDAARTITGMLVSQAAGQTVFSIVNVGSFNITLSHQSASSTAANRFLCKGAADIVLAPDEEAAMWYDGTTQRWRVHKV